MLAGLETSKSFLFLVLLPLAGIYFLSLDADYCLFSMGLDQGTSITLFLLLIVIVAAFYNLNGALNVEHGPPIGRTMETNRSSVPFILLSSLNQLDHQSMFRSVHKCLETYRAETHGSLETLSRALDVARDHSTVVSHLIHLKIERLSAIFNEDMETLQKILCVEQLHLTRTLPSAPMDYAQSQEPETYGRDSSTNFVWNLGTQGNGLSHIPYDSIRQVVAHVVRDWSEAGSSVRAPLYNWIILQLQTHKIPMDGPVLVPGAGLGRLAYEIAFHLGRSVEALESSITMATMADAVLRMPQTHMHRLHPYASDPFANEINSNLRYESVSFPDIVPSLHDRSGSLSYTLAEFSKDVLPENHYSAVVTCFFIDTAATFFDYLATIEGLLVTGGIFINVGPLHWHPNSHLPLAADEMRAVLESRKKSDGRAMFDLLGWTVDDRPLKYRDSRVGASTFNDGYLPIRFVLRRR